jgi:hypothetical protein
VRVFTHTRQNRSKSAQIGGTANQNSTPIFPEWKKKNTRKLKNMEFNPYTEMAHRLHRHNDFQGPATPASVLGLRIGTGSGALVVDEHDRFIVARLFRGMRRTVIPVTSITERLIQNSVVAAFAIVRIHQATQETPVSP